MLKGKFIILSILLSCTLLHGYAQDTVKAKNIDGSLILPAKSVLDNLASAPNFSAFYRLIKVSGVFNNVGTSPVTILAPANKAFAKLPPGQLDTLIKPENSAALTAFVNNHLLAGKITSANIAQQIKLNNGTATLTTLAGNKLTAKIDANRNILLTDINGNQSVISRFDIAVQNGLMHVVTGVLTPAP
ncbi:MAG: fasciclin domain-containing protein [Mucilaginibacter sp.]